MNIIKWFKGLFGIEDLTLEEVPRDFNYNNYDPHSPIIKRNKEKLRKQYFKKKISYKQYTAACTAMKSGFKNQSFTDLPPEEFSNKAITGSNFMQDNPNTDIFPSGVVNCTLRRCNTFNCKIPAGFTIDGGKTGNIKTENDGEYWYIDKDSKPVSPVNDKIFDLYGISKDPRDIPSTPTAEPITATARKEQMENERRNYIEDVVNDPVKFQKILDDNTPI